MNKIVRLLLRTLATATVTPQKALNSIKSEYLEVLNLLDSLADTKADPLTIFTALNQVEFFSVEDRKPLLIDLLTTEKFLLESLDTLLIEHPTWVYWPNCPAEEGKYLAVDEHSHIQILMYSENNWWDMVWDNIVEPPVAWRTIPLLVGGIAKWIQDHSRPAGSDEYLKGYEAALRKIADVMAIERPSHWED